MPAGATVSCILISLQLCVTILNFGDILSLRQINLLVSLLQCDLAQLICHH